MQKTIYVTNVQSEQMKALLGKLDKLGIDVRDNRGELSISLMLRLLVQNKFEELILDEVKS